MDARRTTAATNNAEWCDLVCRSHGAQTLFDDDTWTSETRTPAYYPDAVTLVPDPSVRELLSRIDTSAGCSIKDSFASLDLTSHGFRTLFDAQWVVRASGARPALEATSKARPAPEAGPRWEVVRTPSDLDAWEQAWVGGAGPTGIFGAELLDNDSVAVLAARANERVVAGAILNRSATVVGISNFFAESGVASAGWSGCLTLAGSLFPEATFVGYESGDRLVDVRHHGFETVGPLRVWIRSAVGAREAAPGPLCDRRDREDIGRVDPLVDRPCQRPVS
jgi:hypothetical protein